MTDLTIDDGVVLCAIAERADAKERHRLDSPRWSIEIGFCGATARDVARRIGDPGQPQGALNRIRRLISADLVERGPGRFAYDPDEYRLTDCGVAALDPEALS